VPDITDSVSIEGVIGPVFGAGNAVTYSAHLRWDFEKDKRWTLYAIGGVGGTFHSVGGLTVSELYPRFGVGAFYKMTGPLNARVEISHETIIAGINVPFY
jgi:hypothetical protein